MHVNSVFLFTCLCATSCGGNLQRTRLDADNGLVCQFVQWHGDARDTLAVVKGRMWRSREAVRLDYESNAHAGLSVSYVLKEGTVDKYDYDNQSYVSVQQAGVLALLLPWERALETVSMGEYSLSTTPSEAWNIVALARTGVPSHILVLNSSGVLYGTSFMNCRATPVRQAWFNTSPKEIGTASHGSFSPDELGPWIACADCSKKGS